MPSSARAQSQAPQNPVRMAMLYMPNGVNVAHWYPEGVGPRLQTLADSRAAGRPQRPDPGPEQSLERRRQGRRRPLLQRVRHPHLRHHQEDSRRRSRQRHLDGPGGRAEARRAHAAALAGTRDCAGRRRRGPGRGLHADLRFAYLLEQCQHAAGARSESARRLRAPVSRRHGAERRRRQTGHAVAGPRARRRQAPARRSRRRRWRAAGRVPLGHALASNSACSARRTAKSGTGSRACS